MTTPNDKKVSRSTYFKDLLLLFSVPAAIAVIAALVVYIPPLFAHPKSDFMYSICDDYNCKTTFSVDGSGRVAEQLTNQSDANYYSQNATLHYYDASNDSNRSLTLAEADRYKLNTSSKSPDGYMLTEESSDSGFLFWGNYHQGWYLKDGMKKKTITLSSNDQYSSQDVKFLGWVQK